MHAVLALALIALTPAQLPAERPTDPAAQAAYDAGKRLYDAKDYAGALAKFDEAAAVEPNAPRWQYNRGLALRKLGRTQEAIDALLRSRALDPEYKRREIDEKLADLGYATAPPPAASGAGEPAPAGRCGAFDIFVLGCFGLLVLWLVGRKWSSAPERKAGPRPPPDQVQALATRLDAAARSLGPLQHAFAEAPDAELWPMVDDARQRLRQLRASWGEVVAGTLALDDAEFEVRTAERLAANVRERLLTLHGPAALARKGPRVGCYFCGLALPHPTLARQVQLRSRDGSAPVLACSACATACARGQSPQVLTVAQPGGMRHWSEAAEFDPYVDPFLPHSGVGRRPAWEFQPSALGSDAARAVGGAAFGLGAGLLAGAAVNALLDLDAARESDNSRLAAGASARRSSKRDARDHS